MTQALYQIQVRELHVMPCQESIINPVDRLMLAMRRMCPAPDEAVRRMQGGYQLLLHPNADRHERYLYDARTYEPATLALFDKVLRPGDTMVDIGANLGLMTLHAAWCVGAVGTVVALEPHPVYFARLVHNIELNDLRNVRAIQVAAGAVREQRTIYDFPAVNIGRSSLISRDVESNSAGIVSVERLDKILEDMEIGPVRLLKIDVEGFEPQVLKGASETLSQLPVICMELSSAVSHGDNGSLAAHDIIISSGLYASYNFVRGKGTVSSLVEVTDRDRLERQVHDNVVYIPRAIRTELPLDLFIH